jgi:hypothetical protein
MAAPKTKSKQASSTLNRLITEYTLRGLSSAEVAEALGEDHQIVLTPQAVTHRLRAMNKAAAADREALVAEQAQLVRWVIGEAMDAWQRSQGEREVTTTEKLQGGKVGEMLRAMVKREELSGDAAYLGVILKGAERLSKLYGLDAPQRTELTGPDGGPLVIDTAARQQAAEELEAWRREQAAKLSSMQNAMLMPPTSSTPTGS